MSRMRGRVGGKIDARRLGQLVAQPGIDPRVWCSLCVIDKLVVDDDGVFADVFILSTATADADGNVVAQRETVRVASPYSGAGWGIYAPLEPGDEVIVNWPDGDPDHGGILVSRNYSTADTPPQLAKDNPADFVLVAKKDVNIRVVVQGKGNVVMTCEDGKVLLGSEDGTMPAHRQGDPVALGTWSHTPASGVGVTPCQLIWAPAGASPTGPTATPVTPAGTNLTGQATNGSGKVEIG